MLTEIYQVDAFAERLFEGNAAAVCPLDAWLDDRMLQSIASENNLSETAFFVGGAGGYELRWFTPAAEVDLCGHATLAAAHVLFEELGERSATLRFETRSGPLAVRRDGGRLSMTFPKRTPEPIEPPDCLLAALDLDIAEVLAADDLIVVVDDARRVDALQPDFRGLHGLPRRGVAVTAVADEAGLDFVSRWFGPNVGVDEDPVTGSAHTALAPLWAARLGRTKLVARQGGARQGRLTCTVGDDHVELSGSAIVYLRGTIAV